ncbi:Glycosyl transferases group 1 [uncultured archaeon]|nr:Glycosyl transferases group 1 [uncultured archaeon]
MKICFFSPGAYSYLSQRNTGSAGGAELHQALVAKELAKKGFDISFIVDDYGQENVEVQDGIKILKFPIRGYTNVIYFPLRVYRLLKVLEKAGADIYYQRAATAETGIIAFFCAMRKRKFVYGMSSDIEVNGIFTERAKFYERILYNSGVKRAKRIIVQSEYQHIMLKKKSDLDSIIIKNPCYQAGCTEKNKPDPPVVLWVGTIKPEWKQPGLFLELARAIPDAKFQMVGGSGGNRQFYDGIKKEAELISNLEFTGFVPYPEINNYFNSASILVNTSTVEGFSNTFLQAWAGYTPVVSLSVDPDEIICKYKLGFHSGTFEQMVFDVKTLIKNKELRDEMGMNGRRYVEKEHDLRKIVEKYTEVFEKI